MAFLLSLLASMPARVGYTLAAIAYVLVYHVFRYRRSTVRENLRFAFPELDDDDRRTIERRFYRLLAPIDRVEPEGARLGLFLDEKTRLARALRTVRPGASTFCTRTNSRPPDSRSSTVSEASP